MTMIVHMFIAAGIFFGDLAIKNQIDRSRTDAGGYVLGRGTDEKAPEPRTYARGRILIRKYRNRGAMLNLGQKYPGAVAAVSVVFTLLTAAGFLLGLGQRGNRLFRTGMTFLLGGAFSNTYDRLKRRYVVDYLTFRVGWKPLGRVVFNISDFAIMIGAMLAVLGVFFDEV